MAYQWITGEIITAAKLNDTGGVSLETFPVKTTVNTWSTLGSTSYGLPGGRAASIGNKVYIPTGPAQAGDSVSYDILLDSFSTIADASALATFSGVAALSGFAYKAGGQDGTPAAINTFERYNPATNSWTTLAALPATRTKLRLSPTRLYLYATGGSTTYNGTATNDCIQYDPVANTWTAKATLGTARKSHGAEGLLDRVFVVSGTGTGGTTITSTEQYTESTNTWASKAAVTSIDSADPADAINTAQIFGYVYLVFTNRSAYWDAHANTWTTITTAPSGAGPTGQSDVAIYLIDANFLGTVRRYNPDLPGRYKPGSPGVAFVHGASPANLRNNITGQNAATVTFKTDEWLINQTANPVDVLILGG